MDQQAVVDRVKALVVPLLENRKVELVELTCRYGGGQWHVRFLVDTPQGIRVNTLSSLNQAIGVLLDGNDCIPERYTLEVSSPGLDRPLQVAADFERVVGRRIRVVTSELVEGNQEHAGELLSAGEEMIVLELDSGQKRRIALTQIARAKQDVRIR